MPQGTTVLGGGYNLQADNVLATVNASQPFQVSRMSPRFRNSAMNLPVR